MRAWKFLDAGAVGPVSRRRWVPGQWVSAPAGERICACRIGDLPRWVRAELWTFELDGAVSEHPMHIEAPRARLGERVEAWDAAAQRDFTADCLRRLLAEARSGASAPVAAALASATDAPSTLAALDALEAGRALLEPGSPADHLREVVLTQAAPIVCAYITANAYRKSPRPGAVAAEIAAQARFIAERCGLG